MMYLHGRHVVVLGTSVTECVRVIFANSEMRFPTCVPSVKITILEKCGSAAHPLHLSAAGLFALRPIVHEFLGLEIALAERRLPAIQARSAEQRHAARVAMNTLVNTLLLRMWLGLQAFALVLVRTPNCPGAHATAADRAALAPLRRDELVTSRIVLARLLRRWLRSKSTLMVLSRTADHLARLNGFAALHLALFPGIGDPPRPISLEASLHGEGRRQRRQFIVAGAAQRLLAHQPTLRLRALLGIFAVPSTTRRMANVLARQHVGAL
mmetsp:Transcript_17738/g.39105  ORF Transcript_17738/g.39105 Transcript_17738/m.39105 type:complete len:268 (-) Transcript_17738:656-1459(-)